MRAIEASVAAGAILASAAALPAYAGPPADQPMIVVAKDCTIASAVPGTCVVTKSSHPGLPAGSRIVSYGPPGGELTFAVTSIVLDAGKAGHASGQCMIDFTGTPLGLCAISGGNGTLAGLQAVFRVSVEPDRSWQWMGRYLINPATQ